MIGSHVSIGLSQSQRKGQLLFLRKLRQNGGLCVGISSRLVEEKLILFLQHPSMSTLFDKSPKLVLRLI